MPDASRDLEREGWGVSGRRAAWIAASFFGALMLFIAAVGLFYRLSVSGSHTASPSADPSGPLQSTQRHPDDHLPLTEAQPPAPTQAQARAIDLAIGVLTRKGDAGWAPLQPGPAP